MDKSELLRISRVMHEISIALWDEEPRSTPSDNDHLLIARSMWAQASTALADAVEHATESGTTALKVIEGMNL